MFSPQPDQTLKPLKHAHCDSIFKLPPSRVALPLATGFMRAPLPHGPRPTCPPHPQPVSHSTAYPKYTRQQLVIVVLGG